MIANEQLARASKVAFISHSCIESSSRRKLAYLALQTELRLITPSWYPTPFGRYEIDFDFNSEVPVQSYPISFLNVKRTSTRWLLRSSDLGFSRFQPDIIHVENEHHSWIVCQVLIYRRRFAPKAKVVLFSWGNLSAEKQGTKARLLDRLARFNCQFVDFFICGNAAGKQILMGRGVSENRVEVLPQFGVDADIFYPCLPDRRESMRSGLGISPDEFSVGFVGRFVEEKGLLDLVEAVGKLRAASQRAPVLVLTGKGPLEGVVRGRCAQLGIRLTVMPACKNHKIAQTMSLLDVLVLPSQSRPFWKEQFGRVLIEAMACGTPVIGSDSGEIPNVIGDAGLVFHESDRERLAECLVLCCDNEGFRLGLRERGLERVRKNYTNEKIVKQTLQIYERVMALNHTTYAESGSFRTSS